MVKTNLIIQSHEDKTSQGGKDYTRFKCLFKETNEGKWMSAFETDLIKELKANENREVSVEVAQSEKDGKTYFNLREFYGIVGNIQLDETPNEKIMPPKITKTARMKPYEKDPVGLAVEIFCNLNEFKLTGVDIDELMNHSIDLVKQAEKAFS